MKEALLRLAATVQEAIASVQDLPALHALRVNVFGKKGELTHVLQGVGHLPVDERPQVGQVVNQIKQTLQACFEQRAAFLEREAVAQDIKSAALDVTLDGRCRGIGSIHPVTQVKARVLKIFSTLGFTVMEGPEVEDEYHNFTALNIPATHPARASHDTFYFTDSRLLRTHTSSVQIRAMEAQSQTPDTSVRFIAAGRVYRRDSDQTHTPMFHQAEGLIIDPSCSFSDLKGLLHDFLRAFFEDNFLKIRFRPSFFPFTEPSAEVDIYDVKTERWLEVLGCGLVHPAVLRHMNRDPEVFSGCAFGLGLDRLAMLRYQIPDLRLLFENDIRFLRQFLIE